MKNQAALARFSAMVALAVGFAGSWVLAGGPADLTPGGVPVRWNPARVGFVIDNGPLGNSSRDQAANTVRAAFKVWEDVPTSTIAFDDLGFLSVDVDATNYESYLDVKRLEGNVIVFDSDGAITDDFFGEESDDILGFAAAVRGGPSGNFYDYAFAVLSGPNSNDSAFQGTMIHEFGHLVGLDHTQAGHEQAMNGITADNTNIPIMYPFRFPFAPNDLRPDDRAWISWLYPTPDFAQTTGSIKGQVFYPPGTPLPGAHVVAVQVTTATDGSLTESGREFVSVVSDFLAQGDGSFEIPGLAPGNYLVFIEPLFPEFKGGSGVGPFESRFENFFKDYYNATGESDQDDPEEKIVAAVAGGQSLPNINLIANQIFNRLDLLADDSEMLYKFPAGFSFPFFGKTYTEVFVNSDGNLTFERGDHTSEARDPNRFLDGPPRIAPLFTDLDASVLGEVRATSGSGEITFTWDGVPEFADSGFPDPNHFSVTLFANGNIRFKYEQLDITADPDERFPGGLQAVVGITPGGGVAGQAVDLSASTSFQLTGTPIYEVFPGTSLDLAGREVNFVASTGAQLLFPLYAANAVGFSGYAFTNNSSQNAALQFQARGPEGGLLPFGDNPHQEVVPGQTQLAKLGSELFGIPQALPQNGWIKVLSDTSNVASFFQIGDGLAGPVTKMDGSVAVTAQSKTLFFSRIYDGLAVFPTFSGLQNATTWISLVNPNNSAITVRFTFYAPTGQALNSGPDVTVPPNGFLRERVSTLVDLLQTPLNDGFVRADVIQGDGAIGFELIELDQSLMGLNASYGNSGQVAYSAQLASGTDTGFAVFTNLKLINTSSENRVLTVTAYGADGMLLAPPLANVTLLPNQTLQRDAGEMFGGSTVASLLGSLLIEADGPGIIGDVVFGDPQAAAYAAAVPLQTVTFTRAVFSQVANGQLSDDPSMDAFTGIALFNPHAQDAEISLRVFDRAGRQVGNTRGITLGPRNRMSDLIENLVPGTSSLIQGYISIDSGRPVVAQELFGNASLSFLSAVPPHVVQ